MLELSYVESCYTRAVTGMGHTSYKTEAITGSGYFSRLVIE